MAIFYKKFITGSRIAAVRVNARSIGNKHAQVVDCITSGKFDVFAVVETWHDSTNCPKIIVCMLSVYRCTEGARQRSSKEETILSTYHGGVCLLHRLSYVIRQLTMPCYRSVEVLAVNVQRSWANIVIVVVYNPVSASADKLFFDEFADLMERVAALSVLVAVVGDVNIHLDYPLLATSVKFNNIIFGCDMVQLVTGPTHTTRHTLDVFITQSSTSVNVNIDPPVYSDHSLISAEIRTSETVKTIYDARTISKHDWTRVDFEAFKQDLLLSMLFTNPPVNFNDLFICYDQCLQQVVDSHAPLETKVKRGCRLECWYTAECKEMKAETRRLERISACCGSTSYWSWTPWSC